MRNMTSRLHIFFIIISDTLQEKLASRLLDVFRLAIKEIKYLALFQMWGTDRKNDLEIPGTETWADFFSLSVMEMTEGFHVHVCCPRVCISIAYNWMEYHVLSIGVLCKLCFAHIKTFTCICEDSNNSWNQVPMIGVQISQVWRFQSTRCFETI